jgi:hypothetical protein
MFRHLFHHFHSDVEGLRWTLMDGKAHESHYLQWFKGRCRSSLGVN